MKNIGGITKLFFALIIMIGLAGAGAALSKDGGGSWQYYKNITISNGGGDLTDYQVLVNLAISNFPTNAQSDGADIRFADASEKELNYWIENWDYSGKNAHVWVKVPRIPANGEMKIKMYYGNPSAGAVSNGDTTFEFFDDFNSLSWQKFGSASTVSTLEGKSVVTITGWGEIVSPISLQSPNYAFESMSKLTSGIEAYMPFFGFGSSDRTNDEDNAYQFGYNVYNGHFLDDIRIFKNPAGMATSIDGDNSHSGRNGWTKTSFMVFDGILMQKVDDSSKGMQQITLTDTAYWDGIIPKEIGIIVWNGATYAVDWVLIRKYTSTEPITSIGTEQTIPGSISVISSPSGAEVLVDGVSKGTAAPTLTVSGIAPGSHAVKCKLSGYLDYDSNVVLTAGSVASINCALIPAPISTPTTPIPTTPAPTTTPTLTPIPAPTTPTTALITGNIMDAQTDKPVQDATITIDGNSTITGSDGEYQLVVSSGNHNITVNKSGYETRKMSINVSGAGTIDLSITQIPPPPPWWSILILVIILVLAAIILYLWTKGNLQIIHKQTSVPCDGKSSLPIKVQFVNVFGKPRKQSKDREVEVEATSGKIQNIVIPAGKESSEATLTSSTEGGAVTITAKSGKQKATTQVNFVCEETRIEVDVSSAAIPADGSSTATVTIKSKDATGKYVTSLNERTVELTTTLGTITSPVTIPPKTLAGIAIVTSGQVSGTAIITASIAPLKGEGKIAFAELPKKYCMHCGAPMAIQPKSCPVCGNVPPSGVDTRQCSTCGAVLPLTAKFCDKCGAKQPM